MAYIILVHEKDPNGCINFRTDHRYYTDINETKRTIFVSSAKVFETMEDAKKIADDINRYPTRREASIVKIK